MQQKLFPEQPFGRKLAQIGKMSLSIINKKLNHLDIERSFYPLILIESGNGKLSQQELANLLGCDKVLVVRIIRYLSEKGYVKKIKNKEDNRKCRLDITGKARKVLPDIKNAIAETEQHLFNGVNNEEIKLLKHTINLIEQNISSFK